MNRLPEVLVLADLRESLRSYSVLINIGRWFLSLNLSLLYNSKLTRFASLSVGRNRQHFQSHL